MKNAKMCLGISYVMSKTKVLLLGAGFIADIHIESYKRFVPEAVLVGIYSRTEQRAMETARRHGIEKHYSDWKKAILDSDCEVVDICLPNFLHCQAACFAAEHGKHVIIEKPLCLNMDEADLMNLAVDPTLRRQGVARALLISLMARLYDRGARSLTLDARVGNVPALALYAALGFEIVGRRKNYYEKPREDAYILRRALGEGSK